MSGAERTGPDRTGPDRTGPERTGPERSGGGENPNQRKVSLTPPPPPSTIYIRFVLDCGKNLANRGGVTDTQDPYVKVSLYSKKPKKAVTVVRSLTVNNGGTSPSFKHEELLVWIGPGDWNKKLLVQLFDSDTISDDLIGESHVNMLGFMCHGGYRKLENPIVSLLDKKKKKAGALLGRVEFLPAGALNVMVHGAINLRNPDFLGKPDPYIKLSLEQCVPMEYKSMASDELENRKSRKIKHIDKGAKNAIGGAREATTLAKQTKSIDGTLNPEWLTELR